ncbi:MAG: DMT family transporter [Pseudomonadota bacterium]
MVQQPRQRNEVHGILWCFVFLVLDALQAVFFGTYLQRTDAFFTGALVFGVPTVLILLWLCFWEREQLRLAFADLSSLIGLNVTAAGAWLTYLIALQLVEPAIAFTLFSGILPIAAVASRRFGFREALPVRNRLEAVGHIILILGMLVLAVGTLAGYSGFVRGGFLAAFAGLSLAIASGVFITGMLLYGGRLDSGGVRPLAQFGLRFPLYVILALIGYWMGIDAKDPITSRDILILLTIGSLLLAFPIYAVQKAVSLTSTLTITAIAAAGPLVVFVLQMVEGRVDYSAATAFGLAIYFIGAIAAALGGVKGSVSRRVTT